ncbi:hypothetical protein B0919_08735 [Hymenobacter sp. CRA2]|nr:hypothetical protein B0919_08735 [Hymenobacter sp. CRA2]
MLARGWLLCVLLSLLEWLTPLAFSNRAVSSALHCGIWVLSPFVARRLPELRWLPRLLWSVLLGLLPVWLLLCLWPWGFGLIPLSYQYHFFFGTNDSGATWKTTYIYARQNGAVVARQQCEYWSLHSSETRHSRTVKIVPLTPVWQWVTSAEDEHPQGWALVDKAAVYFGPDSTKQYRADALKAGQQRCWQEQQRLDSIPQSAPRLTLPPATQRGAGTLGFELAGKVWRNFGHCFDGQACTDQCPVRASAALEYVDPTTRIYSFRIMTELHAGPTNRQQLSIWLGRVSGPGTYELESPQEASENFDLVLQDKVTDSLYSQANALDRRGPRAATQDIRPARVTITRLDPEARILSGTFEGQLRADAPRAKPLQVSKGRFDVHYFLVRN